MWANTYQQIYSSTGFQSPTGLFTSQSGWSQLQFYLKTTFFCLPLPPGCEFNMFWHIQGSTNQSDVIYLFSHLFTPTELWCALPGVHLPRCVYTAGAVRSSCGDIDVIEQMLMNSCKCCGSLRCMQYIGGVKGNFTSHLQKRLVHLTLSEAGFLLLTCCF